MIFSDHITNPVFATSINSAQFWIVAMFFSMFYCEHLLVPYMFVHLYFHLILDYDIYILTLSGSTNVSTISTLTFI